MAITTIKDLVKQKLCISCGLCSLNNAANMVMKDGIFVPSFYEKLDVENENYIFNICPGKGYPILQISENLYSETLTNYDYRIGYFLSFGAATSNDKILLENSSSGAMISTIANYLLKNKIIDGVVTVKFEYTQNGPIPKPFIATNISDIILSQGSKYLPVPLFEIIDDIINFDGKLAVIGTPCQIAGLRQLQKTNNNLKEKITFTISNFCGGYRDYKETERIFNIMRVDKGQITKFSYRGNGQPGTMSITQLNKPPIHLNYPEYSKLTGYIKYNRCRLCVDATGELADISFGDAWLDRFINSGTKWSFYICRSQKINKILQNIKQFEVAQFQDISLTELIESQKGNLTTKKERQNSRFILYKMLGKSIPSFDGGFNKEESNLLFELKVYINQKVMHLLEIIGLYLIIAKITKRVKKNNYGI